MAIQKKQKIGLLVILFLATVILWIFVFIENHQSNLLAVRFLDVGQGDAEFIETPDKKQVLIDGGPDLTILEKLGRAMAFYDHYIDLIILTHPEADHLNGLIEVAKRYRIGAIITTGVVRDTEEYKQWIEIIKEKNIPIYIAKSDGEIDFGNDIKMKILHPFENLAGQKISDSNNTSIIAQLDYKNFEALFTGDIEKSGENKLIASGINLNSDILKVAHHGSKTSSTEGFLKAVGALVAIIEVGKDNRYGHPHQEVLDRLANLEIFQTGKDGNIEILSDGEKFFVKK
jgi:competence protein ComEC